MKTFLLHNESRVLFDRLQSELKAYVLELPVGGVAAAGESIVQSLLVCMAFQEELHSLLRVSDFEGNREEEVRFFKYIKPRVTAEIEYRKRLLEAVSLGMDQGDGCLGEIARMNQLLAEHVEFVHYYKEGLTYNDNAWFIQGELPLPTRLCLLPAETDPRLTSSRDRWLSGLMAVERYLFWLKQRV